MCAGGVVWLRASGGLSGRGDRVDYCWGGLGVGRGGQFWGLAGGAVLRRGAGSLGGPGVVAAGSGPGGRTALAWVVVLGLGPGVWALPGAPGGALPVPGGVGIALGTPQYGWVGAGPGAGLVALGPGMCQQVVGFLGCWGVRWGGAVLFPCWGGPGWAGVMVGLRPGLLRLV